MLSGNYASAYETRSDRVIVAGLPCTTTLETKMCQFPTCAQRCVYKWGWVLRHETSTPKDGVYRISLSNL